MNTLNIMRSSKSIFAAVARQLPRNGQLKQQTQRLALRCHSTTNQYVDADHGHLKGPALYPRHTPTSAMQKIMLTIGSAFTVMGDPERGDMLAMLGEVTGRDALKSIHARMCADPVGAQILAEKPLIREDRLDLEALKYLPENTFGYNYYQYMQSHGFTAEGRSYVQFVDDAELAYVMQRFRECHDFWHVLFDLPPTVFGEIILKHVELMQGKLPVSALASFVGPLRLTHDERMLLLRRYIPWAKHAGEQAEFLLNVFYEKEFETPLEELRERLNIVVAPRLNE